MRLTSQQCLQFHNNENTNTGFLQNTLVTNVSDSGQFLYTVCFQGLKMIKCVCIARLMFT